MYIHIYISTDIDLDIDIDFGIYVDFDIDVDIDTDLGINIDWISRQAYPGSTPSWSTRRDVVWGLKPSDCTWLTPAVHPTKCTRA